MERFLALGERAGFGRPLALAQDNRLTIALPNERHNLFEPPSYRQSASGEAALLKIYNDIAAVLHAADAIIDLDQDSREMAQASGGAKPRPLRPDRHPPPTRLVAKVGNGPSSVSITAPIASIGMASQRNGS